MSAATYPRIAWAGVAIRLSDGTMQTFELDGRQGLVTADIEVIADVEERDLRWGDTYRQLIDTGGRRVHIELNGRYTTWRRFDDQAAGPVAEIEERRALPAESSGSSSGGTT